MFVPPPAQYFTVTEARARLEDARCQREKPARQVLTIGKGTPLDRAESSTSPDILLLSSKHRKAKPRTRHLFAARARREITPRSQKSVIAEALGTQGRDEHVIDSNATVRRAAIISPFEEAERMRKARGPPARALQLRDCKPRSLYPDIGTTNTKVVPSSSPLQAHDRLCLSKARDLSKPLPPPSSELFVSAGTTGNPIDEIAVLNSLAAQPSRPLLGTYTSTAVEDRMANTIAQASLPRRSTSYKGPNAVGDVSSVHPGEVWHSPTHNVRFMDRMKVRMALSAAQLDPNERRAQPSPNSAMSGGIISRNDQMEHAERSALSLSELSGYPGVSVHEPADQEWPSRSMLQRSGMSPITLPAYVLHSELPDTPTSILRTPIEMYQAKVPDRSPSRTYSGRSSSPEPLPASYKPEASLGQHNSHRILSEGSVRRRTSTQAKATTSIDQIQPQPGMTTPRAMSMRLRCGSVLTIEPPEATPWRRSVYIHGPIKLLKSVGRSRENTVASLDEFQDAVESMCDHKFRRRSDDAMVDDACKWFAQLGLEDVSFDGDRLMEGAGE
ncbi:hypothetical protein K431DRAFT_291137 [Polychaeton citri CBS 116435]|uniref:Uncharacterized protein n=1 Tax=Polychaeton citri CBS 116435 TaxID=1314669 RepID=A0A9P4UTQ5_9PEZI|nr:hypothetical protein K431DRAFT_291137 [Polychaeton citri CBS 116435]